MYSLVMGAITLRRALLSSLVTAALAAAAAMAMWDEARDGLGDAAAHLPWPLVLGIIAAGLLTALHFCFASVALRAAVGLRAGLRELTRTQLAAAAANRVVPGGAGAFGVNLRYLLRAGVHPGTALSGIAALAIVGVATDALFTGAVGLVGPSVGVTGGTAQASALAAHGVRVGRHAPWMLLLAAAVVTCAVVISRRRSRRAPDAAPLGRDVVRHMSDLVRRPGRLAALTIASTATTAVLAVAFAATARVIVGPTDVVGVGALLVTYFVGRAIGGATLLPPFFGMTETALVAGLVVAGVPAHGAVISVAVFRGATFWLPGLLGVFAARGLRRAALL